MCLLLAAHVLSLLLPVRSEVAPAKEEIELKTNEAYGPVGQ